LAFCLAVMVNVMFTIFVLLIFVFSLTYSVPPRIKDLLFLNQLWVAIPRGLLGVLASWSVFGNVLHPVPITIGLIAMFFLIGGSVTKDILDADADKKSRPCGNPSLATVGRTHRGCAFYRFYRMGRRTCIPRRHPDARWRT